MLIHLYQTLAIEYVHCTMHDMVMSMVPFCLLSMFLSV